MRIEQNLSAGRQQFTAFSESETELGVAIARIVPTRRILLDDLHVNANVRGQGVGSALLNVVLGWGYKNNATEIEIVYYPYDLQRLTVTDIKRFYEKRGFVLGDNGNYFKKIK